MERGEFLEVPHESGTPGRSFTTAAMMPLEQETIDNMRAGQSQHRSSRRNLREKPSSIRPRCSAVSRVPFGGFAALDTASAPC